MKFDSSAFVADETLVAALRARAIPIDCTQDRVLFRQGAPASGLYILHSGEATLRLDSSSGDSIVSMAAAPGSLLGLPGLVGDRAYSMTAEAKKGAEISFLSRESFQQLMLTEPALSMKILQVLAAEVRTARMAMAQE